MQRRDFIALIGLAAAAIPQHAVAEPHAPDSTAGRLAGTWGFDSALNKRKDGTIFERWGSSPKGILMFDRAGNYAQIIIGSESRIFGAKTFCAFGTYTVDEAKHALLTKIISSSNAKLMDTVQHRDILELTADQMRYSNQATLIGATAEVTWKRIT
jgi:hypothetical protein